MNGSGSADNGYFNQFLYNEKDGYYFTNGRAMFWDKDTFRLYTLTINPCVILSEKSYGFDNIEIVSYKIQMENIYRLLHRLVHIKEIYSDNSGSLWYKRRLKNSDHNEIHTIKIDKAARPYDYSNAFDISEDKPLVKKLFKPDEKYKSLLVKCYSRTFQAGRSMHMYINY